MEGRDRLHHVEGDFRLMQCENCGLICLNPRPSANDISRFYPPDYISFPTAVDDEPSQLRRLDRRFGVHKRCRKVIKRAGKSGRLLDVGSATGVFLNAMRQRGWDVYGVEPAKHAAEYARKRFNLQVQEKHLEEAEFDDGFFNVITMWDVLEHVSFPDQILEKAFRLLQPGGWLIMTLPNPDSCERRWFGKYWAGWDVPRHFHIFSRNTLARYLNEAGFGQMEVASFTGRHGVLILSVNFWMTDWKAPEQIKRALNKIIISIPARILTWPLYCLADRLNISSIMSVFAQKKND
jgi:SAM-dependent methyltransferase